MSEALKLLAALKTIQDTGAEKAYVANLIAGLENKAASSGRKSRKEAVPTQTANVIPGPMTPDLVGRVPDPIIINTDGGSRGNPGLASSACVIQLGDMTVRANRRLDNATNNEAEYDGVLLALETVKNLGLHGCNLLFRADSTLVVNQLSGKWQIKEPRMAKLAEAIHGLSDELGVSREFVYIPREENKEADKLCNLSMDGVEVCEAVLHDAAV